MNMSTIISCIAPCSLKNSLPTQTNSYVLLFDESVEAMPYSLKIAVARS
jgi:hypothetical protein